ncbi:MAG: hypothetical protein JXN59_07995 [Anaerolineae bacterium]|nr:hypothetical protein [Anaerolineae bacterium]
MTKRTLLKIGLALCLLLAAVPLAGAQENQGRICVAAYNDANQNGTREPMEPLLGDVVVTLQNEQAISVGNYVTSGQAEPYCFEGLAPGVYLINFSGGMVTATGESDFAVTLAAGGIPAQVQFGAARTDALPVAGSGMPETSAVAADENTVLRVAIALAGALVVVVGLAGVGLLIFWLRYRRTASAE